MLFEVKLPTNEPMFPLNYSYLRKLEEGIIFETKNEGR
jgi:hypothetical protein